MRMQGRVFIHLTTPRGLFNHPSMARAYNPAEPPTPALEAGATSRGSREKATLLDATAKWLASLRSEVPTGYEDDTGFHFGPPPAPPENRWQA